MTKEDADPKRGLKQRASSALLTEDQLQRKAWAAWMEAMHEAKQNQVANALPGIQEAIKMHHNLIESEKSKLHSTNDRVHSLEQHHAQLIEELQKLRKSQDLNQGYWKGMTRGLQAAKKTMHSMEDDSEMLRSASQLRNALPPLTSSATSRPASSMN